MFDEILNHVRRDTIHALVFEKRIEILQTKILFLFRLHFQIRSADVFVAHLFDILVGDCASAPVNNSVAKHFLGGVVVIRADGFEFADHPANT